MFFDPESSGEPPRDWLSERQSRRYADLQAAMSCDIFWANLFERKDPENHARVLPELFSEACVHLTNLDYTLLEPLALEIAGQAFGNLTQILIQNADAGASTPCVSLSLLPPNQVEANAAHVATAAGLYVEFDPDGYFQASTATANNDGVMRIDPIELLYESRELTAEENAHFLDTLTHALETGPEWRMMPDIS